MMVCAPSGDGQDRLLHRAPCFQAQELNMQITGLEPHRRPGGGDQRGLQPALAHPREAALAAL